MRERVSNVFYWLGDQFYKLADFIDPPRKLTKEEKMYYQGLLFKDKINK